MEINLKLILADLFEQRGELFKALFELTVFSKVEFVTDLLEFPPKSGHKVKLNRSFFQTAPGRDLLSKNEYDFDYKRFQYI